MHIATPRRELVVNENLFDLDKAVLLLHWWISWLGLDDWTVTLDVVRQFEMPGGQNQIGNCAYNRKKRIAQVLLLDPVDYDDSLLLPFDMEKTLVHELLHVVVSAVDDAARNDNKDELLDDEIEAGIDRMACAFVAMGRRMPHHPAKKKRRV